MPSLYTRAGVVHLQRVLLPLLSWGALSLPSHAADLVLPLTFNAYATPMVRLPIAALSEPLALDTGSATGLHLTRAQLDALDGVHFTGDMQRSVDLSGRIQDNARFMIDSLTIGEHVFRHLPGVTFSPWGLTVDTQSELPDSSVIGLGFFADRRIVIDYAAQTLTVLADDSEFPPPADSAWIEAPFELNDEGLTLTTTIAGQTHRMSLDTGATLSFVIADRITDNRAAVPCQSVYPGLPADDCRLLPIRSEFGSHEVVLHAILIDDAPAEFENTGLFGGDFMQSHAVAVDFPRQRLFVRPIQVLAE